MNVKAKILAEKIQLEQKGIKDKQVINIEKIRQEKLEYQKAHPEEEIKPDCLKNGWFIYIFIMIAGLIFVDYIYLAIFTTICFFIWRHNKIEEANGRKHDD